MFCLLNLTLGIFFAGWELDYIKIKDGRTLTGIIGKSYDRFLSSRNQKSCPADRICFSARCCKLIPIMFLHESQDEERRPNLSASYMMRNNLMDLYAIPDQLGPVEDSIEASKVALAFSYKIGQFLEPNNSEQSDYSSFLFSNWNLVMIILSGLLLVLVLALIFLKLFQSCSSGDLRSILFEMLFLDFGQPSLRSPKFALVILFFNVFLFFNLNFLTGNIKTESSIVKTDEIINSISDLMKTEKTQITLYNDVQFLRDAPEHSFLAKMASKNIFIVRPIVSDSKSMEILKKGIASYFLFGKQINLLGLMTSLAPYASAVNLVAFMKCASYHESLRVFYLRKNLDQLRKRFIHSRIERAIEGGQILNWFYEMNKVLVGMLKQSIKGYEDIGDYIGEYSTSSDLNLANLRLTFLFFFGFLVLMAFLFACDALDLPAKMLVGIKSLFLFVSSASKQIRVTKCKGLSKLVAGFRRTRKPKTRKWSLEQREYLDIQCH